MSGTRVALRACRRQHPQLAGGDEWQQGRRGIEHDGDASGHEIDHARLAAAIGNIGRSVAVSDLNSSPEVRPPPLPDEENDSCPGFAFASAITSLTDCAGRSALTTIISGNLAARITGRNPDRIVGRLA
jgi:hypothetical protein